MNLVDFYLGNSPDYNQRLLRDIWTWDHEKLEEIHDYIQVLFPLPEASAYNSRAPILLPEDIAEFRANPKIRENLLRSFRMMLDFYGLEYQEDPPLVRKASHFPQRSQVWLVYGNHNHLRITRILKCLTVCGLSIPARAFLACLLELREQQPREIGEVTLAYWRDAVTCALNGAERLGG
jgi:hypothetical protein